MTFHINYFLVIITCIKTLSAESVFFITFFCIFELLILLQWHTTN